MDHLGKLRITTENPCQIFNVVDDSSCLSLYYFVCVNGLKLFDRYINIFFKNKNFVVIFCRSLLHCNQLYVVINGFRKKSTYGW